MQCSVVQAYRAAAFYTNITRLADTDSYHLASMMIARFLRVRDMPTETALCLEKNIFDRKVTTDYQILIIFGTNIPETNGRQTFI